MELEQIIETADKLSTIILLLYFVHRESKRADALMQKLITTLEIKDREVSKEE